MRGSIGPLAMSAVVALAFGCNALLGNEERYPEDGTLGDGGALGDGAGGGKDEQLDPQNAPCTTDLESDRKNCGACGHDCLGGACNAGKCQPFLVTQGQTQPSNLVIDNGVAFWTNQVGTVHRCEVASCNGAPKYLTGIDAGNETPGGLAVYGSDLFVLGYYSMAIDRCPITGCTLPMRIAQDLDYPNGITADANGIYVMSANGGWVSKCALPDCAGGPTRIATRTTAGEVWQQFAADETNLYWVGGPNNQFNAAFIWRAKKTLVNGAPEEVAKNVLNPVALYARDKFLYVVENTTKIYRIAQTPGAARIDLVTNEKGAFGVVADDKYAYWMTGTSGTPPGAIRRCALAGCNNAAETIVEGQNSLSALVVTDKALYWTEFGAGTVKGLAK